MSYVIAGRAIKSEWLSIGTLLATAGLAAVSMSGGDKKKASPSAIVGTAKEQGKVGSSEEEEFIRNFIAEAEKADKEAHH